VTTWLERLISRERRRAARQNPRHLIAYYWDGAAPLAHDIRDISSTGLYLVTEQRWYPGTIVMISLQRVGAPESDPDRSIMMKAKVIRSGSDGVALRFVLPQDRAPLASEKVMPGGADRKAFQRFLAHVSSGSGQALIEYVLLLPLIFMLILNMINFAGFFYAWIGVANAARSGADYAALGGASAGSLKQASGANLYAMISEDIKGLPNSSSLVVQICQNSNGAVSTVYGATCSTTPPAGATDPEPTSYVLTWVDVTYTYTLFIPAGFQFPNLNVYLTIPPTTIKRRAIMRMIQ
jgi:Flp pilus assembly protein TadG